MRKNSVCSENSVNNDLKNLSVDDDEAGIDEYVKETGNWLRQHFRLSQRYPKQGIPSLRSITHNLFIAAKPDIANNFPDIFLSPTLNT